MTKNSVGIIGCGWLGEYLAQQLLSKKYTVLTTVRQVEKQSALIEQGIPCELLSIPENLVDNHAIFSQDILVIAITPKFKRGLTNYADNIKAIVDIAQQKNIQQVILVSSTGIYQGSTGLVDEHTRIQTDYDQKVFLLHEAEKAVLSYPHKGQVLRLAGLVGNTRKPGRFLAGKQGLTGANEAVNVIHQTDAAGLILRLIDQIPLNLDQEEKVFIGVSQTTVNRIQYYQKAAQVLSLALPKFVDCKDENTVDLIKAKKVVGDKTRQWLSYEYRYNDLYQWLSEEA